MDECVMRVKRAIEESDVTIPYCCFNGGADVFIDVGNKRVGVSALQKYLKVGGTAENMLEATVTGGRSSQPVQSPAALYFC